MAGDPRLFRSIRSLTVLLAVFLFIMLAIVAFASAKLQRSPWDFWPVYLYILTVPMMGTAKALQTLYELRSEEGKAVDFVWSMALMLPVVAGVLPVMLIMRFAK